MSEQNGTLSVADKFEIFEQLNLHQHYIDNDGSRESMQKYLSLYWPDGKMHVIDVRTVTFDGPDGLKQLYDYAHSVFPLNKMRHSMGSFKIEGSGNNADVEWRWAVNWKEDDKGVLSTGTYNDRFEKRDGVWKCLERTSVVDPNFPAATFQVWIDKKDETYKES